MPAKIALIAIAIAVLLCVVAVLLPKSQTGARASTGAYANAGATASATGETSPLQLGAGLTPAHFPHHSGDDVAHMFQTAHRLGSFGVINVKWNDASAITVGGQMIQLARQFHLTPFVRLDLFDGPKDGLALPDGVSGDTMTDPDVAEAYVGTVTKLASLHPDYLAIGVDVNRFLASGIEKFFQFSQIYKKAYAAAKQASPATKVFVSFNLDIFQTASREQSHPLSELRKLVDVFRPALDVLAFDSMPAGAYPTPAEIPAGYYDDIRQFASPQDEILLEAGWPSGGTSDLAGQEAFIERLAAEVVKLHPKALLWPILHDIDIGGDSPVASLGLYDASGIAKPSAALFAAIGPSSMQTVAQSQTKPIKESLRKNTRDKFAIYVSTLGGQAPSLVVSDPQREINHARVSPDHKWIVFTRYNIFNAEGEALEVNGYVNTEAVVCRINGDDCTVVIPASPAFAAANANWTPDGKGLLFVSNDTPGGTPAIKRFDLATQKIAPFYLPDDLFVADPHQSGNIVVMPGRDKRNPHLSRLYLVNARTKTRRILTDPKFADFTEMKPPLGDHDPKLSPDGSKVAVMRHMAQDEWHIVIVDTATRAETDLSAPGAVDAVPEWSSDGRLLVFWTVDRRHMENTGLATVAPDGSMRRHISLPHGFFYTMPAFFPGGGSARSAKIIYSTKIDPKL